MVYSKTENALASDAPDASYSAADLKLLNPIALQTAAAVANSILCAEMVDAARARAAFAAELLAASTVQQLLLQSASRPTPGLQVESVYLPASEVGGDFFFVSSAPDGSLIAIVGDVAGKSLTAAMRMAMILGALRRENSHDPGEILFGLNNALIAQGQRSQPAGGTYRQAQESTVTNFVPLWGLYLRNSRSVASTVGRRG